jgi:D-alanine-D-alanine ligase
MSRTRVGVLRGGPGYGYSVSLQTGGSVLRHVPRDKYEPYDIFVTKEGVWHVGGIAEREEKILKRLDVVFNALHGEYGEDGTVQRLLETFAVPYTGSSVFASVLGINRLLMRRWLTRTDIKLPCTTVVKAKENIDERIYEIYRTFPQPSVVKPVIGRFSTDALVARSFNELRKLTKEVLAYSSDALIEEYIAGHEVSCGVIDSFRGAEIYTPPPVETTGSSAICPARFDKNVKQQIQETAKTAHAVLGLRHYSCANFIFSPRRGIYLLEVNTLPQLASSESPFLQSLDAVGISMSEFLDHIIDLALSGK